MPDSQKTAWRRLYVFVAVALAVFLAALSAIGVVCHGFAASLLNGPQNAATQPLPIPPELKAALAHAEQQGQAAYQEVQMAVDQYQATDVEIQDLLHAHFDDLLHSVAKAATQNATAQNAAAAQHSNASAPATSETAAGESEPALELTAASQTIVNPRWQDLENQIVQFRKQRAALSDTLLPTHPTIQKLDLSLSDLETQLSTVPKEIPASAAENPTQSPSNPLAAQPQLTPQAGQPASDILSALLPHWQKAANDYRELTARLQTEKSQCYAALNRESTAWQRKAEIPAQYIATLSAPQQPLQPNGADPRISMLWSGLLAVIVAALAARRAQVSQAVFQTAAQVRQRLSLTVLGFLPRQSHYTSQEQPLREPIWIHRTLLAAELYLAALMVVLLVVSLLDHQFFGQLLANPLAACSQKFWS